MGRHSDSIEPFHADRRKPIVEEVKREESLSFCLVRDMRTDIPLWRERNFSIETLDEDNDFKYLENNLNRLREFWDFWWWREVWEIWELNDWDIDIDIKVWQSWEERYSSDWETTDSWYRSIREIDWIE